MKKMLVEAWLRGWDRHSCGHHYRTDNLRRFRQDWGFEVGSDGVAVRTGIAEDPDVEDDKMTGEAKESHLSALPP